MKWRLLCIGILLLTIQAYSQSNSEIVNFLNENFKSFSLRYILFSERELIEFCQDSAHRLEFVKKIARQTERLKQDEPESVKERELFLNILYRRVEKVKVKSNPSRDCKRFVLDLLHPYSKLNFEVDEMLIETRFDPKKRGLPFGDEECDKDFSYYIFFIHNPVLYIDVLENNRTANPSGKIYFPTTCFLEELNYTPLAMKKQVQAGLLELLKGYKGHGFEIIRSKIKNADLTASFN